MQTNQMSYADRQQIEKSAYETLAALAPQIARCLSEELGQRWTTFTPRDMGGNAYRGVMHLVCGSTEERHELHLRVSYAQKYQRIAICGSTYLDVLKCADGSRPHLCKDDPQAATITVSLDKTAKRIAADIVNRVLPNYLAAVRCLRAYVAAHNASEANRQESVAKLARAIGGKVYGDKRSEIGWQTCTIKVDHANDVDVKFSGLTCDEAEDIAKYARVVLAGRRADREVA